uniref:Uncharacterized protein n=1 Tax=Arundo donax TaxID=35708 RepID=A0A0A8YWQ3_ARUDO
MLLSQQIAVGAYRRAR